MSNHKKARITATLALFTITAGIAACGGSSGGASTSETRYTGPGSKWDISLSSDASFSVTRRENTTAPVDMTVVGTYVRQSNGFVRLTVNSATDGANNMLSSPANGDTAWALDVPGYAFMLRPMDANNEQLIPMVVSGGCPSSNLSSNWVTVKTAAGNDATDLNSDFFGTFTFDVTAQTGELPSRYSLVNPTSNVGAFTVGSGTCNEGIMDISNGIMYLASNGAIVRIGTDTPQDASDDSYIFALDQKAISNLSNISGTYAGMLFDDNAISGEKILPVSMACDAAGNCTGALLDADLTSQLGGTVSLDFSTSTPDTPSAGWITGTITDTSSGNISCMFDIDAAGTGKKIASCVGQSPDDNTKLFNVLLVSI